MRRNRLVEKTIVLAAIVCCMLTTVFGDVATLGIVQKNEHVMRLLQQDGEVWRTVKFSRADGSDAVRVRSEEFNILLLDDTQATVDDYCAVASPKITRSGGEQSVSITYALRDPDNFPDAMPGLVHVIYTLRDDDLYLRKTVTLEMREGMAIDRLQTERFTTSAKTSRGGKGEPVFFDGVWFGGLEYPASYIRHGQDFQYRDYKLRNPSKINLEGRDEEIGETPEGLVTMAHFPGLAKLDEATGKYLIHGKTSVFGVGKPGDTIELAFLDYMETVRRGAPRNYLHHNNWYDGSGKNLSVENYVGQTYTQMRDHLAKYDVVLDGMVPDNGWQDRKSIWMPHDRFDIKAVSEGIEKDGKGTGLGLWIALNGYSQNIDWGRENGYLEAERNGWFTRFMRYYSITQPKYNADLRKALRYIITEGNLNYFKHDFNEMCDVGEGRGHLATDRHGHEASVDAMIDLLAFEREVNPDIYQNMTNWIWYSPWWLMHNDCLWMMGADSGSNWSWPMLAVRDFSTTFRDEQFARLWVPTETRPLIPISTLMTHGIIYGDRNKRGGATETVVDWANYVVMYYGRGVMLKELYLTPTLLSEDYWKALGTTTKWAVDQYQELKNTVAIAGNPELGDAHGYVSWTDGSGIVTLRNPDRTAQTVTIPWDQSTWFRGKTGKAWRGRMLYPYRENWRRAFKSGNDFEITVPGDSVILMELEPGRAEKGKALKMPAAPSCIATVDEGKDAFTVTVPMPDEKMARSDLVFLLRSSQTLEFKVDGELVKPDRLTQGTRKAAQEISGGRNIANDSTAHVRLPGLTKWLMCSFDLRKYRGKQITVSGGLPRDTGVFSKIESVEFDAWLIMDRAVKSVPVAEEKGLPWPVLQGYRRQIVPLFEKTQLTPQARGMATALSESALENVVAAKIQIETFDSDGGKYGPKFLQLNGPTDMVEIPSKKRGDTWETHVLDVPAKYLGLLRKDNLIRLVHPAADKFKFRKVTLAVKTKEGNWVSSSVDKRTFCSTTDWAYSEGETFEGAQASPSVRVSFK